MGSALELLLELTQQIRELVRIELSLAGAEISERASRIPSSLTAVAIGIALLPVALGLILVAASLFLLRFGSPLDLAFLIVAVVAVATSLILLRRGVEGLRPSRLAPAKSIAQISSLLGGGSERIDIQ
jgi:hypothetical protein